MRKEEAGRSKQMVSEEAKISKSNPAGAKPSDEITSPTPKQVMKQGGPNQAYELGRQPNE